MDMTLFKKLKKLRKDQVLLGKKEINIGDKPLQDVVIVKSGEIPVEGGFHNEL
jgi:hypothetical protein